MTTEEPEVSAVPADIPKHLALAVEVRGEAVLAKNLVQDLTEKIKNENVDFERGMSLLQLKNLTMIEYLANLSYIILKKTSGKSIVGDEAIKRLVTARTVLEKLRPMEYKLKYQINKAVRTADLGEVRGDDPLNFKANPQSLVSKFGEEEDEEENDEREENKNKTGKYIVPKHVPAFFDDGTAKDSHVLDEEAKKKKQMISKGIIEELKRQHMDTPEEVYEKEDIMKKRHVNAMKERIRYEEDNFIRLPLTKKAKHKRSQLSTVGTIGDEVTSFGLNHFSSKSGDSNKRRMHGKGFKKSSAKKKFKK